eukprot:1680453-Alexandrium_andersonii.AAC.1
MSASLVGSEMCIRDSGRTGIRTGFPSLERRFLQHCAVRPHAAAFCGTVSYTHLTLPTICSV